MPVVKKTKNTHMAPNIGRAYDKGGRSGKVSLSEINSGSYSGSYSGSGGGGDSGFVFRRQGFDWRLRGSGGAVSK